MLERYEGNISNFKSINQRNVQFELAGVNTIFEMTVSDAWVINRGDRVSVAGELHPVTGKFIAYAYRNKSRNIFGMYDASGYPGYSMGVIFVVAALLFAWAIFPLFFHLPAGLNMIKATTISKKFHEKVIRAARAV